MKKSQLLIMALVPCLTMQAQIREEVSASSLIKEVKTPTREKGLQYTLELGYNNAFSSQSVDDSYSGGDYNKSFWSYAGNLVLTYKLNKNLSLGAGAGFQFIWTPSPSGYVDEEGVKGRDLEPYSRHETLYGDRMKGNRKDFFLRGTYRLNNKKFSPLLNIDAGYRLYSFDGGLRGSYRNFNESDIKDFDAAFFVSPSVGFSWRTTNNSYLELKLGYDFTPSIDEQVSQGEWGSLDKGYIGTSRYGHTEWTRCYDKANLSSFFVRLGFTHTLNLLPKTKHERYQYDYSHFDYQRTDAETVKGLFEQALNIPDSVGQAKYDAYMKVVKADPFNFNGYLSPTYNNIGVLFENSGNRDKASEYYALAVKIDPNNSQALDNQLRTQRQRLAERAATRAVVENDGSTSNVWETLGGLVTGISTALGGNNANSGYVQGNSTYNAGRTGATSSLPATDIAKPKGKKVDVMDVRRLERAYDGWDTQLLNMQNEKIKNADELRDKQREAKRIQSQMKEIRKKLKERYGINHAVSDRENWIPGE